MKVAVVGAQGQLGTDLTPVLADDYDVVPLAHADLDVADAAAVDAALDAIRPDVLINLAAYNRVDACEAEPELAMRVNCVGPHVLARACARVGARMLHVSTDYVFSGQTTRPWIEDDPTRPLSMYGISKLAGELAVRAACDDSWVVRVSGLFGLKGSRAKAGGGNFVETMLRLQAEGRPIRVVADQTLGPTYTRDVAQKLRELLLLRLPPGVYHMTAAGECTWYEFARTIFRIADLEVDLQPQTSAAAGLVARRPAYSVLANSALATAGLAQIRPWNEGLRDYLELRRG